MSDQFENAEAFQPEYWTVRKDVICSAMHAIEIAAPYLDAALKEQEDKPWIKSIEQDVRTVNLTYMMLKTARPKTP